MKKLEAAFKSLLGKHNIQLETKWEDIRSRLEHDPAFENITLEAERIRLFKEYLTAMEEVCSHYHPKKKKTKKHRSRRSRSKSHSSDTDDGRHRSVRKRKRYSKSHSVSGGSDSGRSRDDDEKSAKRHRKKSKRKKHASQSASASGASDNEKDHISSSRASKKRMGLTETQPGNRDKQKSSK
ncbi:unnamed protein product, partial [Candidula unifasciata]